MADFEVIDIYEHLGDNKDDIPWTTLPFVGGASSIKEFTISGRPLNGYYIASFFDLQQENTRVLINGRDLPFPNIVPGDTDKKPSWQYQTWFDDIPRGFLVQGTNTFQIRAEDIADNFLIFQVVVHWREKSDKDG